MPGLLFLYFRLLDTVDFHIIYAISVGNNRFTNCTTTTDPYVTLFAFFIKNRGFDRKIRHVKYV